MGIALRVLASRIDIQQGEHHQKPDYAQAECLPYPEQRVESEGTRDMDGKGRRQDDLEEDVGLPKDDQPSDDHYSD